MREIIRIAGIGAWHTHSKDFTKRVMDYPDAEVAAVWDQDEARGKQWAEECACAYQPDIDALFADASIDAVLVTCETTLHYEMISKAAKAGKHIYVEKPPFLTAREAREARKLIQDNHIKFMIGSPIVKPMHLKTQEMLKADLLGEVVSMRYRTVHELALLGTQKESFFMRDANGGGVMQDMGNHALHLLSWFAGAPVRSEAVYTAYTENAERYGVDDNDIAVLEFENGVLGTIETGWVTPWYQYGFDLYGTKGSVSCRAYEMYACLEDGVWRRIPDEELPEPEPYPLHHWIDCIRENKPIEWDNIDVAVLMTEMSEQVEAAAKRPMLPVKPLPVGAEQEDTSALKAARDIAASGRLGEILNIRVHCCGEEPVDALMNQAKCTLYTFFGEPLGEKGVISSSGVRESRSATTLLTFANKRLGIAEACSGTPEYEYSVDLCATHGWLRIRGDQVSYTTTEPGDRNAIWHTVDGKVRMCYDQVYLSNPLFSSLPMCFDEVSPERIGDGLVKTGAFIRENGDVFFRLYAPGCRQVTMQIIINRVKTYDKALEKKEDGFFELLLENDGRFNGPLNLMIFFDGVRLLYPRLPVYWSSGAACNYVEFPSHKLDFCLVQDVPHGSVSARIYYSQALCRYERCLVYTPPGYDRSDADYPVLYLQHGGGENETVWESTGKLSTIMDNAIAQGACVPFLVVMNNGMVRYPGNGLDLRDKAFEDNLLGSCIPFIEREYRVRGDKYSRGIAGLSMGSYLANDIALAHPELFGYVGAFTGCMYHGDDVEAVYPCPWRKIMLKDKGEMVKKEFRVFFQSATSMEDYINYVYEDNRICRENGVANMPGYRFIVHDEGETKWTSWRMGLNAFVKMLFREPEAYQSRQAMEEYYE